MQKSKLIILFSLITILFGTISCEPMHYELKPSQKQCIGDYMSENTVVIFTLNATNPKISVEIVGPDNKVLYIKSNEMVVKASLTTTDNGNFMICSKNNHNSIVSFDVEILSGIDAQDFTSVASDDNFVPLQETIVNLEKKIDFLIKEFSKVERFAYRVLAINDSLSGKIILFSIITLGVMIVVGIFETIYIRSYLRNRKVI